MIDSIAPIVPDALKTTPYAAGSNSRIRDNRISMVE